jgi:hypothetical protein
MESIMKNILSILITSFAVANQPPCEVWNYDTEACETFAEQNLTVNPDWQEYYNNENNNELKKIK